MTEAEAAPLRRLSPRSIWLGAVQAAGQSIIPLVAGSFATGLGTAFLVPALCVSAGFALVFGWLGWRTTWFRFERDALVIGSGILSKQRRSIAYDRIQDVDIERRPLHRLFGLALLRIETGGGDKDEGTLDGVALADADTIRTQLRQLRAGERAGSADRGDAVAAADAVPLYRLSGTGLLLLGVMNFSLVAFALIGGAVQQLDFLLPFELYDPRVWGRLVPDDRLDWLLTTGWAVQLAFGIGSLLLVALVGLAGGIVTTALREWNFELVRSEQGYRRRRGLLTLSDVTIPMRRIQAWVVTGGLIRNRLGRHGVAARTLGGGGSADEEGDILLAPIVDRNALRALGRELGLPDAALAAPPCRTMLSAHLLDELLTALPWFAGVTALALLLIDRLPALGVTRDQLATLGLAAWLPLLLGLVRLAATLPGWAAHRWRCDDDWLIVQHGWWRQTRVALPLANIQSVDRIGGPIGRLTGTRRMVVGVAAPGGTGRIELRYLRERHADGLAGHLLRRAEPTDFIDSLRA